MAIVLLYSFRIVSAGSDSMSAICDLPFQFNKSQNLSFSIVFGFKMIIFLINLSFSIIFYHFLLFYYPFSIKFELKNDNIDNKFIKNYCFTIILGQYNTLERFYSSQTSSDYLNVQSHRVDRR